MSEEDKKTYSVYSSMQDMVKCTLCNKGEDGVYKKECLERKCSICGTYKLQLSPEELDTSQSAANVEWEKFDYVTSTNKAKKTVRKLQLVKMSTKPNDMYDHLLS